jgi:hypothetical protein
MPFCCWDSKTLVDSATGTNDKLVESFVAGTSTTDHFGTLVKNLADSKIFRHTPHNFPQFPVAQGEYIVCMPYPNHWKRASRFPKTETSSIEKELLLED